MNNAGEDKSMNTTNFPDCMYSVSVIYIPEIATIEMSLVMSEDSTTRRGKLIVKP